MLEDLIDRLNSTGWLVNNLYQTNDGQWRANLRNSSHCTAYGTGDTPSEALEAAMLEATWVPIRENPIQFVFMHNREAALRRECLASVLGLTRPITRRV